MPPTRRYTFGVSYSGDRPYEGKASRAEIKITDPDGKTQTFRLSPGELRSLQRVALIGLGYTTVDRVYGQWDSTWQEEIEQKIEPILVVTKALLPVAKPKVKVMNEELLGS